MANVKTAVSLEESLFEQAEMVAREMQVSRSRFFALALRDYIDRRENRKLLERINAAYEDGLDPAERRILSEMAHEQRRIIEGEW